MDRKITAITDNSRYHYLIKATYLDPTYTAVVNETVADEFRRLGRIESGISDRIDIISVQHRILIETRKTFKRLVFRVVRTPDKLITCVGNALVWRMNRVLILSLERGSKLTGL